MKENENEKLIMSMASFISTINLEDFLCKKVRENAICCNGKKDYDYDNYDCIDCILKFFSSPCKWKSDNDVCVNDICQHCADFVSEVECGKCFLKELSDKNERESN